jgi:hypothetical protein
VNLFCPEKRLLARPDAAPISPSQAAMICITFGGSILFNFLIFARRASSANQAPVA